MNNQDEMFFKKLHDRRSRVADALDDPCARGYKDSVVDKYTDQAHFIYELLQNADDAKASAARFILKKDSLIFAHNGKRQFSISNPDTEDADSKNGSLGDVNAITSIANSNKTNKLNTIGKFGVGFKAVFQYTVTPRVYSEAFNFEIDRFIVPTIIDDCKLRKQGETLFVFPFNYPVRPPQVAYADISNKLKNLSYPLLFLTNLKSIEFEFESDDTLGLYGKRVIKEYTFNETRAELIELIQNDGEKMYEERLWLFTRTENNLSYSVGYFIDSEGKIVCVHKPAFCFFPTKEDTRLNFIVHAPFLLNDSREGIVADRDHNKKMISKLASLAGDTMVYLREIGEQQKLRLIDDDIIYIVPTDISVFSEIDDKDKISFRPFFDEIKKAFTENELLPTADGYTKTESAYWAAVPPLTHLFSDEQLSVLSKDDSAKWVFRTIGRDDTLRANKALAEYIDSIVKTNINEDAILQGRRGFYYDRTGAKRENVSIEGITADFIERQDFAWLVDFYKWISDSNPRKKAIKKAPIFIDSNKHATAAFDSNEQLILFFPKDSIKDCTTINEFFLEDPELYDFFKSIGIKEPSLRDQIYNVILPMYNSDNELSDALCYSHFKVFFEYYCSCSSDVADEFIDLICGYSFLLCYFIDDEAVYLAVANSIYFPSENNLAYFNGDTSIAFVRMNEYKEIIPEAQHQKLYKFLSALGVRDIPEIEENEIDETERNDLPHPSPSTMSPRWEWSEKSILGCKNIVETIETNKDLDKSILLWSVLIKIIEKECNSWNCRSLSDLIVGECHYFYYHDKYESFDSSDKLVLQNAKWLQNKTGDFVSPVEISIDELSDEYSTDTESAKDLIDFLGIIVEDDSNLTESQRRKIAFAEKLQRKGITEDELDAFIDSYVRQKSSINHTNSLNRDDTTSTTNTEKHSTGQDVQNVSDRNDHSETSNSSGPSNVVDFGNTDNEEDVLDADDYNPVTVDFEAQKKKKEKQDEVEQKLLDQKIELQDAAVNAGRYTFSWFKLLLDLEILSNDESNSNRKDVSITFVGAPEKEKGKSRTLILKNPDSHIPPFIEDLSDIPLFFYAGDKETQIIIDVASVKSYTLRVKLRSEEDLSRIDLANITSVKMVARRPAFLLDELKKQFFKLPFDDTFDMQKGLPNNIDFVFGPPGTGKTTYLAKDVLIPLMKQSEKCKILVLTPTNKAADVLANRIMEISGPDISYETWLVRFGSTNDENIEDSKIYFRKDYDVNKCDKNVTITTIDRFPYDFYLPQNRGAQLLNEIDWDYVVVDEASMIPLIKIVFPLYRLKPERFIIAGDPFQIEPIVSFSMWKDENIYKMVRLDSFVNPQTYPHQYNVVSLTTQYRSIPVIGEIFSKFAYDGILQHSRSAEDQKLLNFGDDIKISTLNIIKFPVSKYESIYKSKQLNRSAYHIYSALFTYEFVKFISNRIDQHSTVDVCRIGVIAPYRAESDLINKLISAEKLPSTIEVQVGTIHGFQGDECDIIIGVFNAPPGISNSSDMFLNKKNIMNVSISRAKDYMFIIMPDDNTERVSNLRLVKNIEQLIKDSGACAEFKSHDLEEIMFEDSHYLEKNSFATSHQSVNVYGLPENQYEIRAEETAVDIQVHTSSLDSSGDKKNVLDILNVPEDLRADADVYIVDGDISGEYYIALYEEKLSNYTTKPMEQMILIIPKDGQEKKIQAKVDEDARIIYIFKPDYTRNKREFAILPVLKMKYRLY